MSKNKCRRNKYRKNKYRQKNVEEKNVETKSEGEGEGKKSNVVYNDMLEFSTFYMIDIFFFDKSCVEIYFSIFFFL
jgi:hypothetical protein